jgi:hypothetical protein
MFGLSTSRFGTPRLIKLTFLLPFTQTLSNVVFPTVWIWDFQSVDGELVTHIGSTSQAIVINHSRTYLLKLPSAAVTVLLAFVSMIMISVI